MRYWKLLEHDAVNQSEDGGVRSDPSASVITATIVKPGVRKS